MLYKDVFNLKKLCLPTLCPAQCKRIVLAASRISDPEMDISESHLSKYL